MPFRFVLSLGLFLGSMTLGWWLHRRDLLTEGRVASLVRLVVTVTSPTVLCLLFWRMNLRRLEPWLLPLLGLIISCSTLMPSLLYTARARLSSAQTGSFLTSAIFSNVGYLGAFTGFALFGEVGYGLCMLYLIFFTPCFYTLGFWIASHYGRKSAAASATSMIDDHLRFYPFVGLFVGAILSLLGVPRPLFLERFNHVLIPCDTGLYLTAIGTQLTFISPRPWMKPCLAMCLIKFLYTPLIAWILLNLFQIHGLPRMMVLLEASTPVAVSPLVLPLLFGLDRKLSNALWLFTTLIAMPWLLLCLPLIRLL